MAREKPVTVKVDGTEFKLTSLRFGRRCSRCLIRQVPIFDPDDLDLGGE